MSNMEARGVGGGSGSTSKKAPTALDEVQRELGNVNRTMNAVKRRLDDFEKDTKARFDALDAAVAEVKGLIVALPPVDFKSGELSVTGGVEAVPPGTEDDS